jgi:hypothetical protein
MQKIRQPTVGTGKGEVKCYYVIHHEQIEY